MRSTKISLDVHRKCFRFRIKPILSHMSFSSPSYDVFCWNISRESGGKSVISFFLSLSLTDLERKEETDKQEASLVTLLGLISNFAALLTCLGKVKVQLATWDTSEKSFLFRDEREREQKQKHLNIHLCIQEEDEEEHQYESVWGVHTLYFHFGNAFNVLLQVRFSRRVKFTVRRFFEQQNNYIGYT